MKSFLRLAVFLMLAVASVIPAAAQVKGSSFLDRMESARKLYINGSYFAAEKAFMQLSESLNPRDDFDGAEIEAYKVLCAIALDKVNVAGMVKVFCDKYPNAPQQGMVKYALGSRFFETGQYKEALEVFNSIPKNHVYRPQRNGYEFRRAYCNMCVGNLDKAAEGFETIMKMPYSRYTVPSTYYRGYVFYSQKKFEQAVPLFEDVADDSRFELMSRYYAAECKLMLRDFDYVVARGPAVFDKLSGDLKVNMARILSEAYYEKKDMDKARQFLEVYKEGVGGFSRKDSYFAGMLSYNMGDYKGALASFGKVVGEDDGLSQNAHYYSANSYLKGRNKVAAMSEFKAAAGMDYDKVIREDAWFNFAKLSFDVNSDISEFENYLKEYPKSGREDVISNYMAASFLLSNDYSSAVKALSKVRKQTNESSLNLEKAALFAAMQMIDNKNYRAASDYLDIAARNQGVDKDINNLVKYWRAECCFQTERYGDAIKLNDELLSDAGFRGSAEYPMALYNQGYTYFVTGSYGDARKCFSDYVDNGVFAKKSFERDARVRLADTYYLSGEYSEAASRYESIYDSDYLTNDVYPAIQASRAYGQLGNSQKRISILKNVCRSSRGTRQYPQSLFELGKAYMQYGQNGDASECFFTILGMENDSTYYVKSLLELASINVSSKRYERAADYYKEIIETSPFALESQDAVRGLENVYQLLNRPEDFLAYIEEAGMSGLKSEEEKETMLFRSAERSYDSKNYGMAANSFQRFLSRYPASRHSVKAMYCLASSLEHTGRLETAADTYKRVMDKASGEIAEAATESYGRIEYALNDYAKAEDAYTSLLGMATTDDARVKACLGRMRACYDGRRYVVVAKDAAFLVGSPAADAAVVREARFKLAMSYLKMGERSHAQPVFEELAADVNDEYGAQSKYMLVQWAYDQGDFIKVESLVKEFATAGTGQRYWLAKSYIVLGDAYGDMDDFQQARITYETLRDGYLPAGDDDDVLDQVRMRLRKLTVGR